MSEPRKRASAVEPEARSRERRHFLKRGAGSLACILGGGLSGALAGRDLGAVEPFDRKAGRRFKVSCAAYSLRKYLDLRNPQMRLEEFIARCAEWGTDGVELTEYYFEKPVTARYVLGLRRQSILWGQDVTGSPVGNRFTLPPGPERDQQVASLKRWIDVAADLGAPAIRIFAGQAPGGVDEAQARKWVVECIEECGEAASRRGVFLALENHGGVVATADGVLDIVRAVNCEWVGVNLDTGNFHAEDPYAEMARCAPYSVTCQIKTHVSPRGGKREEVDLERLKALLVAGNYRGYVTLEYEDAEDPMTAVPRWLERIRRVFG